MSIAFSRFDCLAADLATARHNWNEHKLKLVLTNGVPDKAAIVAKLRGGLRVGRAASFAEGPAR